MNGLPVRAVTFQSIERTSSPGDRRLSLTRITPRGLQLVDRMRDDIARFIATWLPAYIRDNRNYLTVAIGCTGGQHRSVYLAEKLAAHFRGSARVLVRHRTLV